MIGEQNHSAGCSLDELRLQVLRQHLCPIAYQQGDVILHQGEATEALYFLLSGQVAVILKEESGKQHLLAELSPGDTFGERALLTGELRPQTLSLALQ